MEITAGVAARVEAKTRVDYYKQILHKAKHVVLQTPPSPPPPPPTFAMIVALVQPRTEKQ